MRILVSNFMSESSVSSEGPISIQGTRKISTGGSNVGYPQGISRRAVKVYQNMVITYMYNLNVNSVYIPKAIWNCGNLW